jgi:RHS repeat-associated protein
MVESETRFVWDRHVVIHEVSSVTGLTTWHWEPDTFTPVAKEQGEHRWSIVSDHLGTPTELYDEFGQLTWRGRLDVFGSLTTDFGNAADCPWRWPGQYEDFETGLYSNRWRYYDAGVGLYTRRDPLGALGGRTPTAMRPNRSSGLIRLASSWSTATFVRTRILPVA